MRLYLTLLCVATSAAFFSGYYIFSIRNNYEPSYNDREEISQIKIDLFNNNRPLMVINYADIIPTANHAELIKPIELFEQTMSGINKFVFRTDKECFKNLNTILSPSNYAKTLIWEEFRCGVASHLPTDFFSRKPFIHPSGSSFAYLAYKFDEKYRKSDWVKGHLGYFHLSELGELRDDLGLLPGFFNVLSALNKDTQLGLFNKDNILITPQFILFLQWDIFNIYNYRYLVYKREIVDSYVGKNTSYQLSFHQPGIHCFFKEGQVCWNLNTASILAQASFSKLLLFVLLIALIVIVVWSLYVNLKRERDDSERRKLALRVLTHELRTPISSMMFRIETLMQNVQEMDDESQVELLKLSGDTHRLMRLSEMSRHYLSVTSAKSKVTISSVTIPSLNNFVQDLLDDQEGIIFNPLPMDTSFVIDEYWLSICLKNLLNNAFDHGQPPVVVTLNLHNKVDRELEIEVKDNGSCQFSSFEQMGGEFVKGGESKGSGLGLNIVSQVIEEIGGVIEFYPNPTRFILKIKEKRYAD